MKINIIGSSCVGKTTLSKILAKKLHTKCTDLDNIFIDQDLLKKENKFSYVSPNIYETKIDSVLQDDSWIMEGVYPVKKIMEQADLVVFINYPFLRSVVWQWKRFFTDTAQREKYGFKNNLILTKDIFSQYWSKPTGDFSPFNYKINVVKKILKKYQGKLYVINSLRDKNKFLQNKIMLK